nr:MAG TPA: hypothetical protein [Caudoviricetes sp.]
MLYLSTFYLFVGCALLFAPQGSLLEGLLFVY